LNEQLEFAPVHIPVMPEEVIFQFDRREGKTPGTFVDCTAGEGGHSLAILNHFPNSEILLVDRDEEMLERAKKRLFGFSERVKFAHCNYSEIDGNTLSSAGFPSKVDGILIDAGISMTHYNESERGFGIKNDELLDMRLDTSEPLTAREIIKRYSEKELEAIFQEFGEENWARKLARKIVETRKKSPIQTTKELAKLVECVIPRKFWPPKSHPAVRIFQALRIEVNSELKHLQKAVENLPKLLNDGGIFCVISFHSLEDRIVKHSMIAWKKEGFEILTKKPIIPSEEEISRNHAARSSKLRAMQKKSEL